VQFDAEALRYHGPISKRCFELFSLLGFRTLLADYAPTAQTVESDYSMVCSATELESIIATIRDAGRCGLCVLADAYHSMGTHAVGLALSAGSRHASYIPLGHQSSLLESGLDTTTALRLLRPMLSDPAVLKVGHNLKVDAIVLALVDVPLVGFDVDTMIASYLLDATRSTYQIEDLLLEHVSYKPISSEDLLGRGVKAKKFSELSPEEAINYACERSALVLELADRLMDILGADGLKSLYRDLELPLINVLVAVEREGVQVDTDVLRALSKKLESELSKRQRVIYDLAGIEFNINSPKQLSEVLFEKLKLPVLKKTGKTRAASTSVVVLEELAKTHKLPREVLIWRSLQKLKGTYVDALPKLVNSKTGRVHTSFNQAVATTGRLSSSNPNLQNIPVRTELGLMIRSAFVASSEAVVISADYSQIELRVLAHLSKDESLIQAFLRDDDIHSQTAEKVFGLDSGLEPHELRRRAKIINYSLLYGKTAFTLAKDIGVTQQMAQAFIDAYFEGFPRVRSFIDDTIEVARESGFVATMLGRRRRVPELVSRNGQVRAAAERVAVNMPIQGTAADILKQAMIDIHGGLPASARMILTVHDELVFEVPEASADEVAAFVRDKMEKVVSLAVPLTVHIGIGSNWKEAKA
jgi:DNA polymerase-1